MKNIKHASGFFISCLAAILFLLILYGCSSTAQKDIDLKILLAKHIEARGGYDYLKSIHTLKVTGKDITPGEGHTFTAYYKPPDYFLIVGPDMTQAIDNEGAWMTDRDGFPQRALPLYNDIFSFEADLAGPLVDYQQKGYTVEFLGIDSSDNPPAYKLRIETPDKGLWHIYLDSETFLERKRSYFSPMMGDDSRPPLIETIYSDYREVDGLIFPHKIEDIVQGTSREIDIIERIEIGLDIADSLFFMSSYEGSIQERIGDAPLHHLEQVETVRDLFRKDNGNVRLITILSPT